MGDGERFRVIPPEELACLQGAALGAAGIGCSACGCTDLRVVYTERHKGYILRRRSCRHCGKRVTTREGSIGQ